MKISDSGYATARDSWLLCQEPCVNNGYQFHHINPVFKTRRGLEIRISYQFISHGKKFQCIDRISYHTKSYVLEGDSFLIQSYEKEIEDFLGLEVEKHLLGSK